MKIVISFCITTEMEVYDDCTFKDLDDLDIACRALDQPRKELIITEIQLEEL